MPISCHFRGCKALLSSIVSGAISPLPLPLEYVNQWPCIVLIVQWSCSFVTLRQLNHIRMYVGLCMLGEVGGRQLFDIRSIVDMATTKGVVTTVI